MIMNGASNMSKYPRISKNADIISYIFNAFASNNIPISDDIYNLVWRTLNIMVKNGNYDWLKVYWEYALEYIHYNTELDAKSRNKFKEMNLFYGALLLATDNESMLRHNLSFRITTPEPNRLLPSTDEEIINHIIEINRRIYIPFSLYSEYQMYYITMGIKNDQKICDAFLDYMVLVLLLLPQNFSANINRNYDIPKNVYKNDLIYILNILTAFKDLYEKSAKSYIKYLEYSDNYDTFYDRGLNAIQQVIDDCKREIQNIEQSKEIDLEKMTKMQQTIVAEYANGKKRLFFKEMKSDDGSWDMSTMIIRTPVVNVSEGQLLKRHSNISINFEQVITGSLINLIMERYASVFLFNSPVKTYLIQYNDILTALDKLNVDRNFVLLSNGINLWNYGIGRNLKRNFLYSEDFSMSYNGMEVYNNIGSRKSELIILAKDSMPYITPEDMDEKLKKDLKLIDEENKLYWIEPTIENQLATALYQAITICQPVPLRYIKLNITYDIAKGSLGLESIENIRKYIVSLVK